MHLSLVWGNLHKIEVPAEHLASYSEHTLLGGHLWDYCALSVFTLVGKRHYDWELRSFVVREA